MSSRFKTQVIFSAPPDPRLHRPGGLGRRGGAEALPPRDVLVYKDAPHPRRL